MDKTLESACSDPTEEITIRIPCALAKRVAAYAFDNQSTVTGVIIEALDYFLRHGSK
jgi:hypothetical protein